MSPRRLFSLLPLLLVSAVGCGDASAGGSMPYRTAMSKAGDTTVARTTGDVPDRLLRTLVLEWNSGGDPDDTTNALGDVRELTVGPDGRVFAWDHVTPTIWLYGADGKLVRRVGRAGGGPGEYDRVNGMTVRPDGKLIVWDAGNARLNVYDSEGLSVTSWKLDFGGRFTNNALTSDVANRTWMRSSVRKEGDPFELSKAAWFRWDSSGSKMDTVLAPVYTTNDPFLVARRQDKSGTSTSSQTVPFGRYSTTAVSPLGLVVSGPMKPYVVNTEHNGAPLRIERDYVPVPVAEGERKQRRAQIEFSLRDLQPNWNWDGPDVPAEKPPYAGFTIGLDGRIWVQLHAASEPFEPEPAPATDAKPRPQLKFRPKERRWDVYEPDGRYIGRAVASRLFTPYAMRGQFVWGVLRDEDDVPAIVKMRVDPVF